MIGPYMSFFLLFEYLGDSKEYTALLHIAELIIYSSPKHFHCRRQAHIRIHERRYVESMIAHLMI